MKLVSFTVENDPDQAPRLGLLWRDDEWIIDLQLIAIEVDGRLFPGFVNIRSFLNTWDESLAYMRKVTDYLDVHFNKEAMFMPDEVSLNTPLRKPGTMRIHASAPVVPEADDSVKKPWWKKIFQAERNEWDEVQYAFANTNSVTAPGSIICAPYKDASIGFQPSWGIFISRKGKDISPDMAWEYIGGYTLLNNFYLIEDGDKESWVRSQNFDQGYAIGPWLVTSDEFIPDDMDMIVRLNEKITARISMEHFSVYFEELICYISQTETLYPGDFIGIDVSPHLDMETRNIKLKEGDKVALELATLGKLENTIGEVS